MAQWDVLTQVKNLASYTGNLCTQKLPIWETLYPTYAHWHLQLT